MELLNEKQRFPFLFACILALFTIIGSYVALHMEHPTQAVSNRFYWYMARSAGFTSYGLLSLSVILGVSSSSAFWDRWKLRKMMTQMHQYSALLVFPFLFFHLWGLHQDKSVPFTWITLMFPFTDTYRPTSTGFGVLTVYGWLLIIVTSYIREKISLKTWKTIHYISFPMFILVTLHGLLTGTDSRNIWALVVYGIPSILFIILFIRRIKSSKPKR